MHMASAREGFMKTILVPIEEHSLLRPVLDTALLLARAFDSYIEGFAVSFNLPMAMPIDIAIGVPSLLDPVTRREMTDASQRHFETVMQAEGIPLAEPGVTGLSYGWRQTEMMSDAFVGSYGRAFDAIVLGRPGNSTHHPRLSTAEAALFESGRPVLIAPPQAPATLGRTIVIAWNGSTETARAVAFSMPLLARAERVIVLSVEGWGPDEPTGADLARSLKRHGLNVETRTVPNTSGRHGETILSAAESVGCDLLVKGAYTQSRLRQMILGGATSHILAHSALPVLMAH
jgi:nucleotide-binding universal stress UspA family protein